MATTIYGHNAAAQEDVLRVGDVAEFTCNIDEAGSERPYKLAYYLRVFDASTDQVTDAISFLEVVDKGHAGGRVSAEQEHSGRVVIEYFPPEGTLLETGTVADVRYLCERANVTVRIQVDAVKQFDSPTDTTGQPIEFVSPDTVSIRHKPSKASVRYKKKETLQ